MKSTREERIRRVEAALVEAYRKRASRDESLHAGTFRQGVMRHVRRIAREGGGEPPRLQLETLMVWKVAALTSLTALLVWGYVLSTEPSMLQYNIAEAALSDTADAILAQTFSLI